jgi:hypothetical protein
MLAIQTVMDSTWLTRASGWIALGFLALLGIAILYYIFTGRIDLSRLISEPTGDASMARFQLLIFTFVIAASLFLIIAAPTPPAFPENIPQGILILLGISTSSYLVSKGIQFSAPEGLRDRDLEIKVVATNLTTTAGGAPIQFTADAIVAAAGGVDWTLEPASGMGTIDSNGLYTPPPVPAVGAANPTGTVMVRATGRNDKTLTDTATVTLT